MRIIHIINSLDTGGAERYLLRLSKEVSMREVDQVIVSMAQRGTLDASINHKVALISRSGSGILSYVKLMYRVCLLALGADTRIVCWMYKSHIFGVALKFFTPTIKQFWMIRHSNISFRHNSIKTFVSIYLAGILSYLVPTKILVNSRVGAVTHVGIFAGKKIVYHPNFVMFSEASLVGKQDFRNLGMVCRYDKQKNIPLAMSVFCKLKSLNHDFRVKLIGRGMDGNNHELLRMIQHLGLEREITLLGEQSDPWKVFGNSGIVVATSVGEGFPNSISEAVCRGFPVVSTNVGEAREIIGAFGTCVEAFDASEIAGAIIEVSRWDDEVYQSNYESTMTHLKTNFSADIVVQKFLMEIN